MPDPRLIVLARPRLVDTNLGALDDRPDEPGHLHLREVRLPDKEVLPVGVNLYLVEGYFLSDREVRVIQFDEFSLGDLVLCATGLENSIHVSHSTFTKQQSGIWPNPPSGPTLVLLCLPGR